MANRFRVEIYDANKMNDVTIYSDSGVDKEYLTELVFSNLRKFSGKVNAYVFDNVKDFNSGRSERAVEPKSKETVKDDYYDLSEMWEYITLIGALSYKRENKDEIIKSAFGMSSNIELDKFIDPEKKGEQMFS